MAAKKKSKLSTLPRSQAAYELARLGLTQAEIAAKLGRSQQQVQRWCSGKSVPNEENQALICEQWPQIAPHLWHEDAQPGVAKTKPAIAELLASDPRQKTPRQQAQDLQILVHDLLTNLPNDATPLERAKVMSSAASTLTVLGKLTGEAQEISEARILRLPAWRRIAERILDALEPYPEAARTVAEALDELGG